MAAVPEEPIPVSALEFVQSVFVQQLAAGIRRCAVTPASAENRGAHEFADWLKAEVTRIWPLPAEPIVPVAVAASAAAASAAAASAAAVSAAAAAAVGSSASSASAVIIADVLRRPPRQAVPRPSAGAPQRIAADDYPRRDDAKSERDGKEMPAAAQPSAGGSALRSPPIASPDEAASNVDVRVEVAVQNMAALSMREQPEGSAARLSSNAGADARQPVDRPQVSDVRQQQQPVGRPQVSDVRQQQQALVNAAVASEEEEKRKVSARAQRWSVGDQKTGPVPEEKSDLDGIREFLLSIRPTQDELESVQSIDNIPLPNMDSVDDCAVALQRNERFVRQAHNRALALYKRSGLICLRLKALWQTGQMPRGPDGLSHVYASLQDFLHQRTGLRITMINYYCRFAMLVHRWPNLLYSGKSLYWFTQNFKLIEKIVDEFTTGQRAVQRGRRPGRSRARRARRSGARRNRNGSEDDEIEVVELRAEEYNRRLPGGRGGGLHDDHPPGSAAAAASSSSQPIAVPSAPVVAAQENHQPSIARDRERRVPQQSAAAVERQANVSSLESVLSEQEAKDFQDINEMDVEIPAARRLTDEQAMEIFYAMPEFPFRPTSNEEAECAICRTHFVDGDMLKVPRLCMHRFHRRCIENQLSLTPANQPRRGKCAVCRLPF
jgi:hypothetical protein